MSSRTWERVFPAPVARLGVPGLQWLHRARTWVTGRRDGFLRSTRADASAAAWRAAGRPSAQVCWHVSSLFDAGETSACLRRPAVRATGCLSEGCAVRIARLMSVWEWGVGAGRRLPVTVWMWLRL